jgi:hypothetical protein
MAENKKSFLLYCDLIHTVEKMPKEKAGELLMHILKYVNDENPISDDLIIQLTFEPIKQSLKRDLEKYERIRLKNKENANIRWNKENATASDRIPTNTKNADSDSVNDNVIVKESIEQRKLKFADSLKPFLLMYGKDLLNDFYGYWTQHGENDKKFLAEKQKSFGIERRLETWKRNEKTFNKQPLKADRL